MSKINYNLISTAIYNLWEENDIDSIEELLDLLGELSEGEEKE